MRLHFCSKQACRLRHIAAATICLAMMIAQTGVRAELCGGQNWHSGWLESSKVTYQAYSHANLISVFGGKTEASHNFSATSTASLFDASDSTAAFLLKFTEAEKAPTNFALFNRLNDPVLGSVKATGVQAIIGRGADNDQVLAVL